MGTTMQTNSIQAVAGPEIDAAVAEHVMGLPSGPCDGEQWAGSYDSMGLCDDFQCSKCRLVTEQWPKQHDIIHANYSTNIATAWLVAEKVMHLDRWVFHMNSHCGIASGYGVTFQLYNVPGSQRFAMAKTAPLAICIAALKAGGVEVVEPASQEVPA